MNQYSSPRKYLGAWQRRNAILSGIFVLCGWIVLILLNQYVLDIPIWWLVVSGIILLAGTFIIHQKVKPDFFDAKIFLHKTYPEFEYSLDLLKDGPETLPDLQRIQKGRIEKMFQDTPIRLPSFIPAMKWMGGLSILVISVLVIGFFATNSGQNSEPETALEHSEKIMDNLADSIFSAHVSSILVQPPAYTRRRGYQTNDPYLVMPEGSKVNWTIEVSDASGDVYFRLGENQSERLRSNVFSKIFNTSEIYQVEIKNNDTTAWKSDYYSAKTIADKEPEVKITGIPEYQKINWEDRKAISFNIQASDDYGLSDMYLLATVAKGAGESVKFRDKKIPLKDFNAGNKKYSGMYSISLDSMEMEPGSELYFYIGAKDNCPFRLQMTKSLTYFVVVKDTAQYAYFDDGGMQVDLMPDFFRSQRQIIIDSEKLLKDRKKLSKHEFDSKSNELGFDQKMLRLKYGQFLGEESESGIAIENDPELEADHQHEDGDRHDENEIADWSQEVLEKFGHNHDHEAEANQRLETNGTQPEDPSRPEWVEALSHNHDNLEEKTYYDISIKSKLKAALSEMWDAELHLRLYNPASSLPYQYNALGYLEEIKNHARIYVHRIGFEPPSIKESEKRLSGDMDEIISNKRNMEVSIENAYKDIEDAVGIINRKAATSTVLTESEINVLDNASASIAKLALDNTAFLPILQSMYTYIQNPVNSSYELRSKLVSQLISVLPDYQEPIVHGKIKLHPLKKIALQSFKAETE